MTQTEVLASGTFPQTADRGLVHRLAHDEAFRQAVQDDPARALGSFGIELDASAIPDEVQLPSVDELLSSLAAGADDVTAQWFPFLA